jgi:hypothetical protein
VTVRSANSGWSLNHCMISLYDEIYTCSASPRAAVPGRHCFYNRADAFVPLGNFNKTRLALISYTSSDLEKLPVRGCLTHKVGQQLRREFIVGCGI